MFKIDKKTGKVTHCFEPGCGKPTTNGMYYCNDCNADYCRICEYASPKYDTCADCVHFDDREK